MSWRDCSGFNYAGTKCTKYHGCGLIGCPAEDAEAERNKREIKGATQPIKIGASIPVSMLREKFLTNGTSAVLKLGRELFGDALTDAQIVAIGRREATLRGFTPTLTYHDKPCVTCRGLGFFTSHGEPGRQISRRELSDDPSCPTCGGDGFAPPIDRTETEELRRKVGR